MPGPANIIGKQFTVDGEVVEIVALQGNFVLVEPASAPGTYYLVHMGKLARIPLT